jgi:type I restriction enzyme R subunit
MVQQRSTRRGFESLPINKGILRYHQHRTIYRICESFEVERQRKVLVLVVITKGHNKVILARTD